MAAESGLAELLKEHLGPIGPIAVRRMFGGAGVFFDGLMFGLIVDDTLYLKANDANRPDFEAEGLAPFSYQRGNGQTTVMSYWRAPERLLDEPDEMLVWARKAIAVARAGAAKPPKAAVKAAKTRRRKPT